jgi:hypothetical protein
MRRALRGWLRNFREFKSDSHLLSSLPYGSTQFLRSTAHGRYGDLLICHEQLPTTRTRRPSALSASQRSASRALITFIRSINDDCPNAQFDLPPRCSELRETFALKGPMNRCQRGELTKLVFECPQAKIIKSWHEDVQKYFLENDPKTLACEIPVWAAPDEDPILKELIPIENTQPFPTLTGHIDLIRFSERLLWIWDYKPNAPAERFASQQVYLYARMLACRTGIPLNSFRCGYFDHGLEVTFDPSQVETFPLPPTHT